MRQSHPPARRTLGRLGAVLALLAAHGCGGDDSGAATAKCLPALPRDCSPLYDPSFDAIFKNRIGATCGASTTGGSCHSEEGAKKGLVMQTADEAYASLLGTAGGKKRVEPGNPECSLLMERISSDDPLYRMPPGDTKLSAAERCTIELWIAEGAKR